MPSKIDLTGQRFGRLFVVRAAPSRNKHTYWLCQCNCGKSLVTRSDGLTRGQVHSCGCGQRESATRHGKWRSSIYRIWRGMLGRCENTHTAAYPHYGGRGITICERWHRFEDFYADMGDPPAGRTLDRIDNDGNYCPENCRWASPKEQGRNRSNSQLLTLGNRTMCIAAWAEELEINDGTIRQRILRGWPAERALCP